MALWWLGNAVLLLVVAPAVVVLLTALFRQVQRLNKDLWTTGDAHRTRLWLTLLGGLFAIAIVAIICAVYLAAKGEDATALVALASAVVAGVIGLFANPPTAD